jgi:hypothetical protein
MPATIRTHAFRLTLTGVSEITDAMTAGLYEAGCDDAGIGSCDGVVTIDFEREADSLGDAIAAAVKAVEQAGYQVSNVAVRTAG